MDTIEEINKPEIELMSPLIEINKPIKKKGRPKGPKKIKLSKKVNPIIEEDIITEVSYFENEPEQNYESYLNKVSSFDTKTELKKIYLNNKDLLSHMTIKQINKMSDDEVISELDLSRLIVNNQITKTLSNQILGLVNTSVSWLFNLDTTFNDYVSSDQLLQTTTNNILCDDLLGYINHRFQWCILYGSKVLEYKRHVNVRQNYLLSQTKAKPHIQQYTPPFVRENLIAEKTE